MEKEGRGKRACEENADGRETDSNLKGLSCHFFRTTGFEPSIFPLHPELFKIKGESEEKKLNADILSATSQKAAEGKVVFEQAKSALHLNGAA